MNHDVILQLNEYQHSRAVIFAHIEGQFPSEVFVSIDNSFGILFTTFSYHYAFGAVPTDSTELHNAIREYQQRNDAKEMVFFGPTKEWETYLSELISTLGGHADNRNQYRLNQTSFSEYDTTNDKVTLEFVQDANSTIKVPQATVHLHGKTISFAKALMIGNKLAEIEVWTDKTYRQKGFGFDSSLLLIKYLLDNDFHPIWSCWEQKTISNSLAEKLCFELEFTFPAFVWVKDFGPL